MPMVTRYMIEGRPGQYLTDDGEWTRDRDEAAEFSDEDSAIEEADRFAGASVEKFWRYSEHADFVFGHSSNARLERRFGREGA